MVGLIEVARGYQQMIIEAIAKEAQRPGGNGAKRHLTLALVWLTDWLQNEQRDVDRLIEAIDLFGDWLSDRLYTNDIRRYTALCESGEIERLMADPNWRGWLLYMQDGKTVREG